MLTLQQLLDDSAASHRHLCPRQVLGVRIGLMAGKLLDLELPQRSKRLLTLVETDGCFADGVTAATGCTVGHRTLRVIDYGKVAATFIDTRMGQAVRVVPHPESRQRAYAYVENAKSRWHAQLAAYQIMPDDELAVVQPVVLTRSLEEILSKPGTRVNCEVCGEEIINEREVIHRGAVLCRPCAGDSYYTLAVTQPAASYRREVRATPVR